MTVTGFVSFVPAVAYHYCLTLPAAFTQPGDHLSALYTPVLLAADEGGPERPGRVEAALVGHECDGVGHPDHHRVHAQRPRHHRRRLRRRGQDRRTIEPAKDGDADTVLAINSA